MFSVEHTTISSPTPDATERREARVPFEFTGRRVDQVLAELFPEFSRSRLQQWLRDGHVTVDGAQPRAKDKVRGGEPVVLMVTRAVHTSDAPQNIALDVVYEDDQLLVVNKPAGLVVHPAAGNPDGTLLNALLHHAPELAQVPRAGIVHRLDKDTSGLLVVARTLEAQTNLVEQLQARSVSREYDAIVCGVMVAGGTVEQAMDRHPHDRMRMAVVEGGREAITHYRVIERLRAHTHVRVRLETGRTHQIRVHMEYIQHPIVGDKTYGGRLRIPRGAAPAFAQMLKDFQRQALHAAHLALEHPASGEAMEWHAPLPHDMVALLHALRADAKEPHHD